MPKKSFVQGVHDLAEAARATTRDVIHRELDYTPESLKHVETLLAELDKRLEGLTEHAGADQLRTGTSLSFGAYFGELVRKLHGGEWANTFPGREVYGPVLLVKGAPYFPVKAAALRAVRGPSCSLEKRYAEWTQSMRSTPPNHGTNEETVANHMFRYAMEASLDAETLLNTKLDFSSETLPNLDSLLVRMRDAPPKNAKQLADTKVATLKFGAYLGEVLRRHLGGAWTQGGVGVPENLPVLSLGELHALPLGAVAQFVDGNGVQVNEVEIRNATHYFEEVTNARRGSLVRTVTEGEQDLASLYKAISDDSALAEQIVGWLESATVTADTKWDLKLDFSEASVEGLEKLLGVLHDGYRQPAAEGDPKPTEEQVRTASIVWGVYLGELVRRRYGGKWVNTPLEGQGPVLRIEIGSSMVFPLAKVQKRIVNGPGDSVVFFFRALETTLSMSGERKEEMPTVAWRRPSAALLDLVGKAFELAFKFTKDTTEPLAPFLLSLAGGKRTMESYAMVAPSERLALGRRKATSLPSEVEGVALVYDGYVAMGETKTEAFIAEAHERGAQSGFILAQRYEVKGDARKPVGHPIALREHACFLAGESAGSVAVK